MPAWKDMILHIEERGSNTMGIKVLERQGIRELIVEMRVGVSALIFLCKEGDILAICFAHFCEQKPVQAVFGGGESHVIAILEALICIGSVGTFSSLLKMPKILTPA